MKNNSQMVRVNLAGDELRLLPERAIWKPATSELFIADTHFGKEAAFRSASIPIPDSTELDLARLTRLVETTRCQRLVVLGDLIHNRAGVTPGLVETFAKWRADYADLRVILVRGNHDRFGRSLPENWKIEVVDPPSKSGRLTLVHEPDFASELTTLAGHLHPKTRVKAAADSVDLPCFFMRKKTLVLPAFASFVDGMLLSRRDARAFAIVDDEVLDLQRCP